MMWIKIICYDMVHLKIYINKKLIIICNPFDYLKVYSNHKIPIPKIQIIQVFGDGCGYNITYDLPTNQMSNIRLHTVTHLGYLFW